MLSATRCPALAFSTAAECTCTPRTRPARPDGSTSTGSSRFTSPDHSVPVTTVPAPAIVNTRSTGRRIGSAA